MTRARRPDRLFCAGALLAALCAGACQTRNPVAAGVPAQSGQGGTIERTSQSGPVTATVRVSPQAPRLGDALTLELSVDAEAGVDLEMPPFGDALGAFSIVEFAPSSQVLPTGATHASQRYVLDTPMSGKQTIPSFLIEFTDRRPGQAKDAGNETHELLTEEISLEVASVLAEGEVAGELSPLRGPLPENPSAWGLGVWLGILGGAALAAAAVILVLRRRRHDVRARVSAFDAAMARLAELESKGWPAPEHADTWYVELSAIVRRYLEDRFGLRAPELTTEEFLREAGRSEELSAAHRSRLGEFLEACDRVKFAAYRPGESESRQALASAREFVKETRLERAEEAASPPTANEKQVA